MSPAAGPHAHDCASKGSPTKAGRVVGSIGSYTVTQASDLDASLRRQLEATSCSLQATSLARSGMPRGRCKVRIRWRT